jgi:hypothetical protein
MAKYHTNNICERWRSGAVMYFRCQKTNKWRRVISFKLHSFTPRKRAHDIWQARGRVSRTLPQSIWDSTHWVRTFIDRPLSNVLLTNHWGQVFFSRSFFCFPLLVIIPPLPLVHLSLSPEVYDSPKRTAHYHPALFGYELGIFKDKHRPVSRFRIIIVIDLQSPLLGLGRFFSFLVLYTVGRKPWTRDQPVARSVPTHRTTQTQNKRTQRYRCLEWDSNPRSQCSSEWRLLTGPEPG